MGKDIMFLATVPSMIVAFNSRNIRMLQEMGYTIHAACNFNNRSAWTDEEADKLVRQLQAMNVKLHQIDISRKPWHPLALVKSYKQIKKLVRGNTYCMMHNQSCVSGIIGRIAYRKSGMKIIHTEHGFYYFKGGPLINWIFYPFDKLCSRWTDVLITINKDDYEFSKKHMRAKRCVYIPGVGIDTAYYHDTAINRAAFRARLGIPENAFVIISVGELNENKNHRVIIEAVSQLNAPEAYYLICGEGSAHEQLQRLIQERQLEGKVILTGNVNNVNEYLKAADVFVFPSKREGLGLAALEAMASGLPLLCSNRNGINDYAQNGETGYMYEPDDVDGFSEGITKLMENESLRRKFGAYNSERAKQFGREAADTIMKKTYMEVLGDTYA